MVNLDKLDHKIVNILVEKSNLSLRKIAVKVGVSVATVLNRIKRLEKEKVISKYTVQLDYERLGYDVEVIIQIKLTGGNFLEAEKTISKYPNVASMYDLTGSFDALIIAKFATRRKMDTFVKQLQNYDFVERTDTSVILNTIKKGNIGAHGL